MTTPMSPETQQGLAELTRKSLAKLLDRAHGTVMLLVDLERQAAERRGGVEAGDMSVIDEPQYGAALNLAAAMDKVLDTFKAADPVLFCAHGHTDQEACAEGAHDQ